VNTKSKVNVAKGFCGKVQKTNATINFRIKANGVYINPNLLDTGSKSDNSPCRSPSYLTFIILYEIKTINPRANKTTTTPKNISITVASEKLKENNNNGNMKMLKRSFKCLYLILFTALKNFSGYF
jgi:hypothetical protein